MGFGIWNFGSCVMMVMHDAVLCNNKYISVLLLYSLFFSFLFFSRLFEGFLRKREVLL